MPYNRILSLRQLVYPSNLDITIIGIFFAVVKKFPFIFV